MLNLAISHCSKRPAEVLILLTRSSSPSAPPKQARLRPSSNELCYVLPLEDQFLSWYAWRTTLVEGSHTSALLQVPSAFRVLFKHSTNGLSIQPGKRKYLVAHKNLDDMSATLRLKYNATSLEEAELEWACGSELENWAQESASLQNVKTRITHPFSDIEDFFLDNSPGDFSSWIELSLCEFITESYKSRCRHNAFQQVWQQAEGKATSQQVPTFTG